MARMDEDETRDAAGVGPYAHRGDTLKPLHELDDWAITDGSADIRGWRVVTLGGRELGRVEDLLVDVEEREVVMFTIDLKDSPRTARAPLRVAQIERDARLVRIDSADLEGAVAADVAAIDRDEAAPDATDRDVEERARGRERLERERIERRAVAAAAADRIAVSRRDRVVERDAELDADRPRRDAEERVVEERAAKDAPVERVVERRPVVVEEVVVRRRTIEPEPGDAPRDASSADAELRRDKPGETF